jgi:hypothetical protein
MPAFRGEAFVAWVGLIVAVAAFARDIVKDRRTSASRVASSPQSTRPEQDSAQSKSSAPPPSAIRFEAHPAEAEKISGPSPSSHEHNEPDLRGSTVAVPLHLVKSAAYFVCLFLFVGIVDGNWWLALLGGTAVVAFERALKSRNPSAPPKLLTFWIGVVAILVLTYVLLVVGNKLGVFDS